MTAIAPKITSAKKSSSKITLLFVRTKRSYLYLYTKSVTNPAHCFQNARAASFIEFFSKIFDMDIDNITERIIIEIPEMTQEFLSIHDFVRVAHKVFK